MICINSICLFRHGTAIVVAITKSKIFTFTLSPFWTFLTLVRVFVSSRMSLQRRVLRRYYDSHVSKIRGIWIFVCRSHMSFFFFSMFSMNELNNRYINVLAMKAYSENVSFGCKLLSSRVAIFDLSPNARESLYNQKEIIFLHSAIFHSIDVRINLLAQREQKFTLASINYHCMKNVRYKMISYIIGHD